MGVEIFRFEMAGPEDGRHLRQILDQAAANEARRIAIVGKTEGTATVNDFGRSLATRTILDALSEAKVSAEPHIILSTGSEGIISPGGYLILDKPSGGEPISGLAFGMARSVRMRPADMMNDRHIDIARQTTLQAIKDAGLDEKHIVLVLSKSPLLLRDMADGLSPEQQRFANQSWAARGAAALGIGIALNEVDAAQGNATVIGRRHDLHSRRAMVFSGTETDRLEIIVLGNKPGETPAIRAGLIKDIIDIDGLAQIATGERDGGIEKVRALQASGRVVAAFMKGSIAPNGKLRGNRTTVYSSDLDPDKHMRAAASGVLGALLGDSRFFVSGGAEHQAPPGGCVFAVILRK